ncbi:DUF7471 family protein [Halosegnis longus]|uniref:Uncharacterized protein n=1 Tax=Halosegnis longus TaxID=2216012 RepID=A0AAJ4RAU9_9EURY|nr:hypothetical protein [Salella cibi]RNJ27392.1 hypothetical protein Nmn1133_12340 [Salella cibi]
MATVLLSLLLGVGTVAAGLVVAVALAALLQRRSIPYLLVTLALATVFARALVGVALALGVFPDQTHHTLEHALDAVMVGLVIAAVYTARHGGVGE